MRKGSCAAQPTAQHPAPRTANCEDDGEVCRHVGRCLLLLQQLPDIRRLSTPLSHRNHLGSQPFQERPRQCSHNALLGLRAADQGTGNVLIRRLGQEDVQGGDKKVEG